MRRCGSVSNIINGVAAERVFRNREGLFKVFDEVVDGVSFGIKQMSGRPAFEGSFTVPDGQLFVLGDNRYWGGVPLNNIVGKVVYVWSRSE